MSNIASHLLTIEQRTAIGDVVTESAWIEYIAGVMIAHFAHLKPHAYEALVAGKMLGTKLDLLSELGTPQLKSTKLKKEFDALITRLKQLNSERSILVHGLWEPEGGLTLADLMRLKKVGKIEAVQRRAMKQSRKLKGDRLPGLVREMSRGSTDLFNFFTQRFLKVGRAKRQSR